MCGRVSKPKLTVTDYNAAILMANSSIVPKNSRVTCMAIAGAWNDKADISPDMYKKFLDAKTIFNLLS